MSLTYSPQTSAHEKIILCLSLFDRPQIHEKSRITSLFIVIHVCLKSGIFLQSLTETIMTSNEYKSFLQRDDVIGFEQSSVPLEPKLVELDNHACDGWA